MIRNRHIEGDPLDAIRLELVHAGRRRLARRRSQRRLATAAAALFVLLAASAGASALTNFSTGVPTIDRLLDVESPSSMGPPVAGDASEPLSLPTDAGAAQAVAYLTRDDLICHAEAEPHPRIEGAVRGGGGGCYAVADLAEKLDRERLVWSGTTAGPQRRVFTGYANAEVESIRVPGGTRAVEASLTPPWKPDAPGAQPLRFFAIVDETDIDVGSDGLQPEETSRLPLTPPRVEVTDSNGRTFEVHAP